MHIGILKHALRALLLASLLGCMGGCASLTQGNDGSQADSDSGNSFLDAIAPFVVI